VVPDEQMKSPSAFEAGKTHFSTTEGIDGRFSSWNKRFKIAFHRRAILSPESLRKPETLSHLLVILESDIIPHMINTLFPRTSNTPVSDEELAKLEETLDSSLPSQLKALLVAANGAWIPDVVIPSESCPEVPGGGIGGEMLYSAAEIIESRETYTNRVSPDLLVFGNDDFGNALCIGLHGPRQGQVYFWDHENDVVGAVEMGMEVDPELAHQNEFFVAHSLFEFITLYQKADPD
jgi:hypothetical protein